MNAAGVHYVTAGRGEPVILLHGYTQTSRMWKPIMPRLAKRFTVIAPDLPGSGGSAIPRGGIDMPTAAARIHELARSLGVGRARVVGHDIGLMVAYAYAAQFPADVEKLVVMDAFLPGVAGWETIYNHPGIWHFRFNGPTPEALVKGRERAYFVSFPATASAFAELSKRRLAIPILAIGGDKANGELLARQMKLVASDVTVVVLKDTGHWVLEERPQETTEALVAFL